LSRGLKKKRGKNVYAAISLVLVICISISTFHVSAGGQPSKITNISNHFGESASSVISLQGNQTNTTLSSNRLSNNSDQANKNSFAYQTLPNNTVVNKLEAIINLISNLSIANRDASSTNKQLLQQSNEQIVSKIEEVKKSIENSAGFWNLKVTDYISIILAIVALIATIPYLVNLGFAQFYKPKLEAFIPPSFRYEKNAKVKWSDLNNGINFRNNTLRRFTIEVEISMDKAWPLIPSGERLYPLSGLKGGYPLQGGFWRKTNSWDLPGGGGSLALSFPFNPQQENCSLEITIYPRMHLSEFGFPRYFGEVFLRPIRERFRVVAE
jgi:hypothetical protein